MTVSSSFSRERERAGRCRHACALTRPSFLSELANAYTQLALPAPPRARANARLVGLAARLERAVQRTAAAAGLPACGPLG